MLFILYYRFFPSKEKGKNMHIFYRVCIILVLLFLLRYFCDKFIFTAVNYPRFTDSGLFPLIQAIFYPEILQQIYRHTITSKAGMGRSYEFDFLIPAFTLYF